MADHKKTVYAPSARSKCDADLELPNDQNSSRYCCQDCGGIFVRATFIGTIRPIPDFNTVRRLTSFCANRQQAAEKHVIKLGNGRNVYG
jgi:hypothetical protein